jgi:putative chitinase
MANNYKAVNISALKKPLFFAAARAALFEGKLAQDQVDSLEAILTKCQAEGVHDLRQVAYVLATAYHEVGPALQPKRENLNYSAAGLLRTWPSRFSETMAKAYARQPEKIANLVYANRMGNGNEASGDGWRYRGRDFCQTTGKDNYKRAGLHAKVDLVAFPDRIMEPAIAACNLVCGMRDGWFTGRKLSHYIHGPVTDWVGARRIINGVDKAQHIANHAKKFYDALTALK